jgi:hypothetical protein
MAIDTETMTFASIATVLVSEIKTSANVNLVAATDMVDVALMATAAFETTMAAKAMVDVPVMATLGSNEPLE